MIQTLTQKVLRTAEEAKNEVTKLKKDVEPIIVKETEPAIVENEEKGFRVEAYGWSGEETPRIIKALGDSKYSLRSVPGINKETSVPREKVIEVLEWLQKNGLSATTGEPGHYWSFTEKGRNAFNNIIADGA